MSLTDQTATGPGSSPLIGELLALISERLPRERADLVAQFARAYFRRIAADLHVGANAEEMYGQVVGIFELADGRGPESMAVRVLNPTLESDGYATAGSVIETNTLDSPFLVDSVTEELSARGLHVRLLIHPIMGIQRGADGRIGRIDNARSAAAPESVMHFEVDRPLEADELRGLQHAIRRVLGDVQRAVKDYKAMKAVVVERMIPTARSAEGIVGKEESDETVAFLTWLEEHNFVMLGYREYSVHTDAAEHTVEVVEGSGLGILADPDKSQYAQPVPMSAIDQRLRKRFEHGPLLTIAKANRLSTVHRRAKLDYVGVRVLDDAGETIGELRLLGLFTSHAYAEPASRIPVVRRKFHAIVEAEDLLDGTYDYKTALTIFEAFPKDELFVAGEDELRRSVMSLLQLQERRHVKLFERVDLHERSVSLVVALPRDRVDTQLRRRLEELFLRSFGGTNIEYHLHLGESDPAQLHFRVHVMEGEIPDVSFESLEQAVVALARTWDDKLAERLTVAHGPAKGAELAERYAAEFPDYYKSSNETTTALLDIKGFERVRLGEPFVVQMANELEREGGLTRISLYKGDGKIALSELIPILETLGLRVVEEVPTRLNTEDDKTFLHDFGVVDAVGAELDLASCGDRVADCIAAVWRGDAEADSLNRLVVTAGLDWRQVAVLRALRRYRMAVGATFTEEYTNDAFAANPAIAEKLVRFFEARFDPARDRDEAAEAALRAEILSDLDEVSSLDEDRILRKHLQTVEAIVRTSVFRDGRSALAFKFVSARVPDMPKPFPLFEIFVYSPEVEAIHLRGGKVARGGLRWSDRKEDYRTEVLGLMKAQMVKNAVIVPVGSKGGFVLKRSVEGDGLRAEVTKQYVAFISSLLDVTDNLVEGQIVHPPDVRVLDEDDPYLVVAADKGTATFSDTANGVSEEYGFWLGDAFASGGSAGYDHKKLAITARGAWESVKRHFRELGIDVMAEPFTVVGVGDMSGDVFGNGMLLSPHIRLVAAFDHRDIFIDPDPDEAVGFAERKRLFELPRSSWQDYDAAKISKGGGIFPRSAKSIELSPEVRRALGVEADSMSPTELMSAILKAPVDLLWNGGIGTYVKAAAESNAEAGDRANDAIRINGADVRARVLGEGGNLGCTQLGRIEYAANGGSINTDAVDNSAGVDSSDHEVNLKILLGLAEQRGDLTRKQRDELLEEVTEDVVQHVLYDNYLQAQILSQELPRSASRLEAYEELMLQLEAEGLLEREIEFLPSSEEMAERRRQGHGMSRPELCVLLAYAKRSLKAALSESTVPDDPYLDRQIRDYFPDKILARFGGLISEHPLRSEMVAMIVGNDIVNSQGITFASRLVSETGAEPADVARAYWIAREVTNATPRWNAVEALDGQIDPVLQDQLLTDVDEMVEDVARWYLANMPGSALGETIEAHRRPFDELEQQLHEVIGDNRRAEMDERIAHHEEAGVPADVARFDALTTYLVHAPEVIAAAQATGRSIGEVATTFLLAGDRLQLHWLRDQVQGMSSSSRWERWALQASEDDINLVRREAAEKALRESPEQAPEAAVTTFLNGRTDALERLERLMATLRSEPQIDPSAVTVALRQVRTVVA